MSGIKLLAPSPFKHSSLPKCFASSTLSLYLKLIHSLCFFFSFLSLCIIYDCGLIVAPLYLMHLRCVRKQLVCLNLNLSLYLFFSVFPWLNFYQSSTVASPITLVNFLWVSGKVIWHCLRKVVQLFSGSFPF